MSQPPAVASPYLLPPGPARRRMMAEVGIPTCCLDFTEEEMASTSAVATSEPSVDWSLRPIEGVV